MPASNLTVSIGADASQALAQVAVLQAAIRDTTRTMNSLALAASRTGDEMKFAGVAQAAARLQDLKARLAEAQGQAVSESSAFEHLRAAVVPAFAAQLQFAQGVEVANRALQAGAANVIEYGNHVAKLREQLAATNAAQAPRTAVTDLGGGRGFTSSTAVDASIRAFSNSRERLLTAAVPAAASEKQFTDALREADAALKSNLIDIAQYIARVEDLKASLVSVTVEQLKAARAVRPTGAATPGKADAKTLIAEARVAGADKARDDERAEFDQEFRLRREYKERLDRLNAAGERGSIGPDVVQRQRAAYKADFDKSIADLAKSRAEQGPDTLLKSLTQGHGAAAQLSFQVNDIITQLSSGTSLQQTLLQQGGQILQLVQIQGKEFVSIFRQMASVAPLPFELMVTGAISAAAAIAVVAYQSNQLVQRLLAVRETSNRLSMAGTGAGDKPGGARAQAEEVTKTLSSDYAESGSEIRAITTELNQLQASALPAQKSFIDAGEALAAWKRIDASEAMKEIVAAAKGGPQSFLEWANATYNLRGALAADGSTLKEHTQALIDAGNEGQAFIDIMKVMAEGAAGQGEAARKSEQSWKSWASTVAMIGAEGAGGVGYAANAPSLPKPPAEQLRAIAPQLPEVAAGIERATALAPEEEKRRARQRDYNQLKETELALEGQIEGATMLGASAQAEKLQRQLQANREAQANVAAPDRQRGAGEERADESALAQLQTRVQMAEQAAATDISKQQEVLDARRKYEAEITRIHQSGLDEQTAATRAASQQEIQYRQETLDKIRQMYRERLEATTFQTVTLPAARDPLNAPLQLRLAQEELRTRRTSGTAYDRREREAQEVEVERREQEAGRYNIERRLFQTSTLPAAIAQQDPYAQLRAAQQRLADARANPRLYGQQGAEQAQLGVVAAERQARDYELQINQARVQGLATLAEASGDLAKIVDLRRQEYDLIVASQDKTALDRERARQTVMQAQLNVLRQSRDLAMQSVQGQNQFDTRRLQTNTARLNLAAEIGDIRPSEAIAQEGALTRQVMARQEQRLEARTAAVMADPHAQVEEKVRANQELSQLYEEDAQKQIEIQSRLTQAIRAENEKRIEDIKSFFKTIESGATSAFASVVTGQKTAAAALKDLRQNLTTSLITSLENMASKAAGKGIASAMGIKLKEGEDTSISNVLSKALGNAIGLTTPEPETNNASISAAMQKAADANQVAVNLFAQAVDKFAAKAGEAPLNAGRGAPDTGEAVGTPSAEAKAAGATGAGGATAGEEAPARSTGGDVGGRMVSVLRDRGWSDAAISGALNNSLTESSLNPNARGAAGEYGLFQFHPRSHLNPFLEEFHGNRSVENQTKYMAEQVEKTMPDYKSSTDARVATGQFMTGFERPRDRSEAAIAKRYSDNNATAQAIIGGAGQGTQGTTVTPSAPAPVYKPPSTQGSQLFSPEEREKYERDRAAGRAAGNDSSPLSAATPVPQPRAYDLAVGDSIAAGLVEGGYVPGTRSREGTAANAAIAGGTQSGRVPSEVLNWIKNQPAETFAGKNIVLSTGATNTIPLSAEQRQAEMALVPDQLKALQGAGASGVTVLGTGAGVTNHGEFDRQLREAATAAGAGYTGPLEGTPGARWHPQDYGLTFRQAQRAAPASVAEPDDFGGRSSPSTPAPVAAVVPAAAAPVPQQTLSDLLKEAQPRYGAVSGGADLMADMRSAYGNIGLSTMSTALRIKSGLGDEQLKPLVDKANSAIQTAQPGLDIEGAFKSGKPSLDELLKLKVPEQAAIPRRAEAETPSVLSRFNPISSAQAAEQTATKTGDAVRDSMTRGNESVVAPLRNNGERLDRTNQILQDFKTAFDGGAKIFEALLRRIIKILEDCCLCACDTNFANIIAPPVSGLTAAPLITGPSLPPAAPATVGPPVPPLGPAPVPPLGPAPVPLLGPAPVPLVTPGQHSVGASVPLAVPNAVPASVPTSLPAIVPARQPERQIAPASLPTSLPAAAPVTLPDIQHFEIKTPSSLPVWEPLAIPSPTPVVPPAAAAQPDWGFFDKFRVATVEPMLREIPQAFSDITKLREGLAERTYLGAKNLAFNAPLGRPLESGTIDVESGLKRLAEIGEAAGGALGPEVAGLRSLSRAGAQAERNALPLLPRPRESPLPFSIGRGTVSDAEFVEIVPAEKEATRAAGRMPYAGAAVGGALSAGVAGQEKASTLVAGGALSSASRKFNSDLTSELRKLNTQALNVDTGPLRETIVRARSVPRSAGVDAWVDAPIEASTKEDTGGGGARPYDYALANRTGGLPAYIPGGAGGGITGSTVIQEAKNAPDWLPQALEQARNQTWFGASVFRPGSPPPSVTNSRPAAVPGPVLNLPGAKDAGGLVAIQTASQEYASAVSELGTTATQAQTSIAAAGQSAVTLGTSFDGTVVILIPLSTSMRRTGEQAAKAGDAFQAAGQSADKAGSQLGSSGISGGGGSGGGGGSDLFGGIGQLASIGTSLGALMGWKSNGMIQRLMAGVSLMSQVTKLFSGGGLLGGLFGRGGGGGGGSGSGLFGGLFSGIGRLFGSGGGLFGGAAAAGGGGLLGGIGSIFSSLLPFLALERGGIIPSAAGGMIVEHSLPPPIKSGIRALANDNKAGLFGGGRLIPHADGGLGVNDGKGGRLIVAHPREMIVPAAETKVILNAMQGGGLIPSAAGGMVVAANSNYHLPLSPVSTGALSAPRLGNVNLSRTISQGMQAAVGASGGGPAGGDTFNVNISALDSRSVHQMLVQNHGAVAAAMQRSRRNFGASAR